MKPLIYSVEDETNIQNVIKIALENSGFDVICFTDADGLFSRVGEVIPDLLLIDIMLPGTNGLELIKMIKDTKSWNEVPIMVISAKTAEIDKVIGLDTGADDYMAKPFGVLELISRVKALLRRKAGARDDKSYQMDGLVFLPEDRLIMHDEKSATLTEKEYLLLELLAKNAGRTISREEMIKTIWGYDFVGESRTIDVHIKEIRQKLAQIGVAANTIQTMRGLGYRFKS